MRKHIFALFLAVSLLLPTAAFAQTVRITPAERKAAEAITADQLSSYLHFIASDAMAGRDTPSAALDVTAEFLKMNLQRWGFKPAGDNGTFFQKMVLRREAIDPAATAVKIGDQAFALNEDFFRLQGEGSATGPLVFGRDGWMVKAKNIDAFQGVDVRGKVVVITSAQFAQGTLTPRPQGVTPDDLKGTKGTDWADPVEHARSKGAAGLIFVAPPQFQQNWANVRNFFSRGNLYVEKLRDAPAAGSAFPVVLVSQKTADSIFAGESVNGTAAAAAVLNKSASITAAVKAETLMTQNVVALWEGSDPVLKKEMVAVGAHYDHVGTNPNARGDDKIWNGADDDGSGTTAVLAMAEALAKSKVRPKRSVLLVWHAGEEKGLWGAEYFNKFPTVDIKSVIAQLNIDMIGRSKKPGDTNERNKDLSGPNEVYVIGSEMMSSTLGAITKGTNAAYQNLTYNLRYDDPKDTNRFFFRSDHFHYAQNGIPIAFWFTGVHEDYHQPGDHPDKIDYQKMEKIARTIFLTMWELTDLKERPKIDKQLPPELTQR
ncbi:MAG: M20/M25/M40 family metallo-hydrolase [Pyrinomonadaceae bacterium]|nr:M20/M25/M40 family metallo-hydrolase [Pyrinomonadaceae bacterium]